MGPSRRLAGRSARRAPPPARTHRSRTLAERVVGVDALAVDEQQEPAHRGADERLDEGRRGPPAPGATTASAGRHDRQVAGLERVERGDPRLQDADPARPRARAASAVERRRPARRPGRSRPRARASDGHQPLGWRGTAAAADRPDGRAGPRRGRRAAARTRARSRRSGPSGRRSRSRPSDESRAQTRRRGR